MRRLPGVAVPLGKAAKDGSDRLRESAQSAEATKCSIARCLWAEVALVLFA